MSMKELKQERLKSILRILERSREPVSGSKLAKEFGVSRQIIVQDIAYLRSQGYSIIATPRGYVFGGGKTKVSKLVAVKHGPEDIKEELLCIVRNGGRVIDVIVEHPVYGEIRGIIDASTEEDVLKFVSLMEMAKTEPLLKLSGGVHLHTIEAPDEEIMKKILKELKEKGFLIEEG
ncbi:transcription repressor NadR [Thermotoga sp.]|uniref:transcription repressor NadR n=1 Tax=Thermotoga sp. TaxID=28240 RepID=UPI0025F4217C|nr:transcription repressor NadR [Thermotoga sp.]MCD6552040.1 transcription repressor NadR [Thermotoga sp.]